MTFINALKMLKPYRRQMGAIMALTKRQQGLQCLALEHTNGRHGYQALESAQKGDRRVRKACENDQRIIKKPVLA